MKLKLWQELLGVFELLTHFSSFLYFKFDRKIRLLQLLYAKSEVKNMAQNWVNRVVSSLCSMKKLG